MIWKFTEKNIEKNIILKNIEKFRNYYDDNKENILEYEKLYYQQNRTEIRDKQKAYFKKYYEIMKIKNFHNSLRLLNKEIINSNSLQRYYNIHNMYYNINLNNELLDQNIIIRFDESN